MEGFETLVAPDTLLQWNGEAWLLFARLGAASSPQLAGGGIAKIGVSAGVFPGHLN